MGIGSPYEPPELLELRVDTSVQDVAAAADAVLALLRQRGALPPAWGGQPRISAACARNQA